MKPNQGQDTKPGVKETVVPIVPFSGPCIAMDYQHPDLSRLLLLEVRAGLVTEVTVLSDPDLSQITISKGERLLWEVLAKLREGY